MLGKDYANQDCTLARALEVVGERWTLLILRDAFYGVQRFSDFAAHLDVPRAVLSDRLHGLVEDGLLDRLPDPGHAGRELYALTDTGRDLWPALHALMRWGDHFETRAARTFVHTGCDVRLDARGVCPACGATPPPEDVTAVAARLPTREDRVSEALYPRKPLIEPVKPPAVMR